MRKQAYRDYATDAFRFHAFVGGYDKYRNLILADIPKDDGVKGGEISKPTEDAIVQNEKRLEAAAASLMDLEAVEKVFSFLKGKGRDEVIDAVRLIYMVECQRYPERGEIRDRVTTMATRIHADNRTVYRWLSYARSLFAVERGLRIETQKDVSSDT